MSRFGITLALSSLLLVAACTASGNGTSPQGVASVDPSAPKRSFKTDVAPMVASKCAPCHTAQTRPVLFENGQPSAKLMAQHGAAGLREIQAGRMPRNNPGSVTAAEQTALSEWLAQGAADN